MNTAFEATPSTLSRTEPRTERQPEREICKKLANKVAVITGASTGMGLATAKRFVQEGVDHALVRKSMRVSRWRRG